MKNLSHIKEGFKTKLKRVALQIAKHMGAQRHQLNKTNYQAWWKHNINVDSADRKTSIVRRVKATQALDQLPSYNEKHRIANSWRPGYQKSEYLSGKGLKPHEKAEKRGYDYTKAGDEVDFTIKSKQK